VGSDFLDQLCAILLSGNESVEGRQTAIHTPILAAAHRRLDGG
jgi:hypothetical protein